MAAKKKAKRAHRYGLFTDLRRVFGLAEEMCGGTSPPEEIQTKQAEVQKLRREVESILKGR